MNEDMQLEKSINESVFACYSCECDEFAYNMREFAKILHVARGRNTVFWGKAFKFCPWCGRELIYDAKAKNLLYEEYFSSVESKIEKIVNHEKYVIIKAILRRYTGSRKDNKILDTTISQVLDIINPRSLLRYRKRIIKYYRESTMHTSQGNLDKIKKIVEDM